MGAWGNQLPFLYSGHFLELLTYVVVTLNEADDVPIVGMLSRPWLLSYRPMLNVLLYWCHAKIWNQWKEGGENHET